MNEKQYVNAIAKKIKCSGNKKKEIKKQLLMDIQMREKQGEQLQEIISRMGTVQEIAGSFNESISRKEQKQYARNKVLQTVLSIVLVLAVLTLLSYWVLPKTADIEQSKYFDKEQVEAAMKETITLLDEGDYMALQENAIPQMQTVFTADIRENIRKTLSDDWGERKQFGAIYLTEVIQRGSHLAVGEITVTYENVSATYRLTYDEEMRLAGMYVR